MAVTAALRVATLLCCLCIGSVHAQCDNACTGSCSPLHLVLAVKDPGGITFVWQDPPNSWTTVDQYFATYSTSATGPWTALQQHLYAPYPGFYDAPPCNTSDPLSACNRGSLSGLTAGTRYYLRIGAGRCCASFMGTTGCETCSASEFANCPVSYAVTSIVAMGTLLPALLAPLRSKQLPTTPVLLVPCLQPSGSIETVACEAGIA